MNLQLTDQLTCPRCGPEYGLILLADRVEARRVYEGRLGCAKCRTHFVVKDGVADLVVGEPADGAVDVAASDPGRLAALMGVTEGPAMLLLLGPVERAAEEISARLEDIELIVAHGAIEAGVERMGVSRIRIGDMIPLRDGGMRAVAVANGSDAAQVRGAARVCALAARVVITNISDEVRASLPQLGLHVLAEQGETLVAVRHG
ncbi:MAG TPA: hypothetical protein VGD49_04060 [Longimicrobiales bacterium]